MKNTFQSFIATSLSVSAVALLGAALSVPAKASFSDRMTYITVNEKIIAGDKVLPPGTYVWKLIDTSDNLHTVQIFNKDQSHLEETILAIPNSRLEPTGKTSFAFWETPPGVPKAVRAWFYPGDTMGQEFAYPKKLIAQLASAVPVPIPTAYKEPEQPAPAATPAPAPESQPQPAATAEPAPAPEPAPQPQPQPMQQANNNNTTAQESSPTLPHTATNTPLIGLIGLSSLGMAALLSLKTKRT